MAARNVGPSAPSTITGHQPIGEYWPPPGRPTAPQPGSASSAQLLADITSLRVVQADALADTSRGTADTDLGWPITVAIEELAYIAHSVPHTNRPPHPRDAYTFLTALHQLADAVTDRQYGSHRHPPYPGIPAPPRHSARSTPRSLMPDGHHSKTAGHETGLLSLGRQHLLGSPNRACTPS